MQCPICRAGDTKVIDSRLAEDGTAVRRRRVCVDCSYRFTTYERADEVALVVRKSDGRVEPFSRAKIVNGVLAASKGRAVGEDVAERLAAEVEEEVRRLGPEVVSSQVGRVVLDRLRLIDEVAYLRFASVYKNFDAAADFESELELLSKLSPGERAARPDGPGG